MTRTYHPKLLPDGSLNPLYTLQKNRHKHKDDEGYLTRRYSYSAEKMSTKVFIAIDGEGMTLNNKHCYVLLQAMMKDWSEPRYIVNTKGLTTKEILNFLHTLAKEYPHAIMVCFGASYDINMWLSTEVSKKHIQELWQNKSTEWEGYKFEYQPRKRFVSRRIGRPRFRKGKDNKYYPHYDSVVTLWDVFGFFQSSFKLALRGWFGEQYPTYRLIEEQKARRSQFQLNELELIREYCTAELIALLDLMEQLTKDLDEAELPVRRWDGAGAIAAAALRRYNIKQFMCKEQAPDISYAARCAYAGGRIEMIQYGHYNDTVYHYDINSAYPSALREVPSLSQGTWRTVEGKDILHATLYSSDYDFSLWYISWDYRNCTSAPFYPFYYRTASNAILFPDFGAGWFWVPEIRSAFTTGFAEGLVLHHGYVYTPSVSTKPFAWIEPIYQLRKQWKAQHKSAEKVLKLAINSLYGKLAQQIGGYHGRIPSYHQIEWAGYCTSLTRARLFTAAATHPQSIIAFATDGIFATEQIEQLDINDELGGWSFDTDAYAMTLIQSGVYWLHTKEGKKQYYRGFDESSLQEEDILYSYTQETQEYKAQATRFVTMGGALASEDQWKKWCKWDTTERILQLVPDGTKRMDIDTELQKNPSTSLRRTRPFYNVSTRPSRPYPLKFLETVDEETIDGIPVSIFDNEIYESDL